MKLSQAILKGCKLSPRKIRGTLVRDGGSCALGAAALAMGFITRDDAMCGYSKLHSKFKIDTIHITHPITKATSDVEAVVFSLNDKYRWPREKIAKYLAKCGL